MSTTATDAPKFSASVILKEDRQGKTAPQHLLLGSQFNALQHELAQQHVSHVVVCADNCVDMKQKESLPDTQYHQLMWDDHHQTNSQKVSTMYEAFLQDIEGAHGFISNAFKDPNSKNVLVHCQIGKNRSATVMLGFVMRVNLNVVMLIDFVVQEDEFTGGMEICKHVP